MTTYRSSWTVADRYLVFFNERCNGRIALLDMHMRMFKQKHIRALALIALLTTNVSVFADTPWRLTHADQPLYPLKYHQSGLEGYVVVEYRIDASGKVVSPTVIHSVPKGLFDGAATRSMASWRFAPTGKGEIDPSVQQRTIFTFQIDPCASSEPMFDETLLHGGNQVKELAVCGSNIPGSDKTKSDRAFVVEALNAQLMQTAYVTSRQATNALEQQIRSEREIPVDTRAVQRVIEIPKPVVNARVRRNRFPASATIMFDITGSGRVKDIELISDDSKADLGVDLSAAAKEWLFEPLVQDGVGVTRVGETASLSVAFVKHPNTKCEERSRVADIKLTVCFKN